MVSSSLLALRPRAQAKSMLHVVVRGLAQPHQRGISWIDMGCLWATACLCIVVVGKLFDNLVTKRSWAYPKSHMSCPLGLWRCAALKMTLLACHCYNQDALEIIPKVLPSVSMIGSDHSEVYQYCVTRHLFLWSLTFFWISIIALLFLRFT